MPVLSPDSRAAHPEASPALAENRGGETGTFLGLADSPGRSDLGTLPPAGSGEVHMLTEPCSLPGLFKDAACLFLI